MAQSIKNFLVILTTAILATGFSGCSKSDDKPAGPDDGGKKPVGTSKPALKTPSIAINLPEKYNTPDGMILAKNGDIYLNCPNFNDDSNPPKVVKFGADNKITEVFALPLHPDTGKCCPLGIEIAPDGNLYIADNQGMADRTDHKSRLIRVNMKDGKAVSADIIATGFVMANAVSYHTGKIYVTETSIDPEVKPMPSGVYSFDLSEFTGEPVKLLPGGKDKHLVAKFTTEREDWRAGVGANGLAFDSKGNMYVCNFGEAGILKYELDADGKVISTKTLAKGDGMESTDGMKYDPATNDLYVADFVGNAVHKVNCDTGKVTTIAKNEDNSGGTGGKLDKPSEVCLRDNKIYVANIDLPLDANKYDSPHTISLIEMD